MVSDAIINNTGGLGKTTVTAELGVYAAQQGKRVPLLDLDPQANLTNYFLDYSQRQEVFEQKQILFHWFLAALELSHSVETNPLVPVESKHFPYPQLRKLSMCLLSGSYAFLCFHLLLAQRLALGIGLEQVMQNQAKVLYLSF